MPSSNTTRESNYYRSIFVSKTPVVPKGIHLPSVGPKTDNSKLKICRDTAAQTEVPAINQQTTVIRRNKHQKLQTESLKKINVVALTECMCQHKLCMRILCNFWKMYRAIKGNYFMQLFGRFLFYIIYMDMGLRVFVMAYNATRQREMVPNFIANLVGGDIKPMGIFKLVSEMMLSIYNKIH